MEKTIKGLMNEQQLKDEVYESLKQENQSLVQFIESQKIINDEGKEGKEEKESLLHK